MGVDTVSSGHGSTAMGNNNTANGRASTAMGVDTVASGSYSTTMGSRTQAKGDSSVAMGRSAITNDTGAIAIGNNIIVDGYSSVGIGLNSTSYTITDNFIMSIMGGNVGIGATSPNSPLEVAGIIESSSGGFKFPDGTIQTTASTNQSNIWSQNGTDIFYNEGNVGIGTSNPTESLEIMGIIRAIGWNGSTNVKLGTPMGTPNHGFISVCDDMGTTRVSIHDSPYYGGCIETIGPNGEPNIRLNSLADVDSPNNGCISVCDTNGTDRVKSKVGSNGDGIILTYGPNGNYNTLMTSLMGFPNHGAIGVRDENETTKASMLARNEGNGELWVYGSNGNSNAYVSAFSDFPNHGAIAVRNENGTSKAIMGVYSQGYGGFRTYGPNGNYNTFMTSLMGFPNHGAISVRDENGSSKAIMYVDNTGKGVISADTKNFHVSNPDNPDTEIWYACIEGPEAGAYTRGTAQLIDGEATIILPEHFKAVVNEKDMTVQVTPLAASSQGLAVIEKSLDGIIVKELNNGKGSYDFDFTVMSIRKGYEDYEVIRPKIDFDSQSPDINDDEINIEPDEPNIIFNDEK